MTLVSRATPVALLARPNGTSLVIRTETRTRRRRARQRAVRDRVLPRRRGRRERRRARAGPPALESATAASRSPRSRYPVAEDQTVRYAAASGDDFAIHLDDEFARGGRPARPDRPRPLHDGVRRPCRRSRRRASTTAAPCAGSPCASRRRSFPATRVTTRVWRARRRLRLRGARTATARRAQGRTRGAARDASTSTRSSRSTSTPTPRSAATGEDGLRPEWREAAARYFGEGAHADGRGRGRVLPRAQHGRGRLHRRRRDRRRAAPPCRNEEIAEVAAAQRRRADPVRSRRPEQGRTRVEEARRLDPRPRRARLQVPPEHPGVLPERPQRSTRSTR